MLAAVGHQLFDGHPFAAVWAVVLAVLNLTEVEGFIGNGHYTIYPAAGFALLGLVLLFRAMFKHSDS